MDGESVLIGGMPLVDLLVFIFVFILTLIVSNLAYVLVRRLLEDRFSTRNSKLAARIINYCVLALGLYYGVYHVLGLDLKAFAASMGVIGIAIAFSSQQIIQNFLSGVLISIQRPIQVEDWVEVGGLPQTGVSRVKDIRLMYTILRDINGRLYYMPNSVLLSSKIINYTKSGFTEIPVELTINQNLDHEKIKKIALDAATETPGILPNVSRKEKPALAALLRLPHIKKLFENKVDVNVFKPKALVSSTSESKITLSIRVWIMEVNKKDEITSTFLDLLIKKLKEENPK